MKGWQIFVHSVRQVFGNLDGALRVSGLLYLVLYGLGMVLMVKALGTSDLSDQAAMRDALTNGGNWATFLLSLLLQVFGGLWIAVGWHRYVLLNEKPDLVPAFRGDRVGGYLLRGLWIAIIMILPTIIVGVVVGLLASVFAHPGSSLGLLTILTIVVVLPLWIIGLRLSASLPAAALGAGSTVGNAWQATKSETVTFVTLAIVLGIATLIIGLVPLFLGHSIVVQIAWNFVIGWVRLMVGVSLLTTLYGHYIEKRPLV